jgi:predicted regulator of Ras-like GTPase activity (Roadblock/LC7/MglB family)
MSLKDLLRDLVYGCGALGALVMDDDGISLDEFLRDDLFDLQGCAVEYVSAIRETRHATTLLESGGVEEMAILTENLRVLIRTIAGGLVLLLVQAGEGNYGKARYLMRRDLHKFQELLA